MSDDPYVDPTAMNSPASTANAAAGRVWTHDDKAIDVNLDGLVNYAKATDTMRANLQGNLGSLQPLAELPSAAWAGVVVGEADITRSTMLNNYREFMQYLVFLQQALINVGSAAQTIADIYGSTDGTAAASLDAVKWAYGDQTVKRPAGLPPQLGQTWLDAYSAQLAKDPNAGQVAAVDQWTDRGQQTNPDGSVTQTAVNQDGKTRSSTVGSNPDGSTWTRTVGPDGTSVTTNELAVTGAGPGGYLQSTTTKVGDKVVGSKTVVTGSGATTTDTYDAKGNLTSQHQVTVASDGSVTTTDTHYDAGTGKTTAQQSVTAGPTTLGVDVPSDPAQDVITDIRQHGA